MESVSQPTIQSVDDHYEVLAQLNQGGMGEVYLAIRKGPLNTRQRVIMKIPKMSEKQEQWAAELKDEARVTMNLNHPNIVRVLDWTSYRNRPCIVTEFIEGFDLRAVIKYFANRNRALPLYVTGQIVLQVAEAFEYVHQATTMDGRPLKIIHRDIDPNNIMLGNDGFVKIIDFGIAKNAIQEELTRPGVYKGKLTYLAPDIFNAEKLDHRADIYSLGLVLFELLTGRKPRQFPSKASIRDAIGIIKNTVIPAPSSLNPKVPDAFDQVVARATSLDPEQRYRTMAEMTQDLRNLSKRLKTGADNAYLRKWMNRDLAPLRTARNNHIAQLIDEAKRQSETTLAAARRPSGAVRSIQVTAPVAVTKRQSLFSKVVFEQWRPLFNLQALRQWRPAMPLLGAMMMANAMFALVTYALWGSPSDAPAQTPIIIQTQPPKVERRISPILPVSFSHMPAKSFHLAPVVLGDQLPYSPLSNNDVPVVTVNKAPKVVWKKRLTRKRSTNKRWWRKKSVQRKTPSKKRRSFVRSARR